MNQVLSSLEEASSAMQRQLVAAGEAGDGVLAAKLAKLIADTESVWRRYYRLTKSVS